MRSLDKLNKLYLHLRKTSGQQTMQDGSLAWDLKVTYPFDHVIKMRYVRNLEQYIWYLLSQKILSQKTYGP